MKSGKSVRVPGATCLNCGKVTDGATAVGVEGVVLPSPGDLTVCLYCGHLMAFDETLQFRELTEDEMVEVAGDERIVAINSMRKK